jgi:multisubunit Na+/H+ antiporter MnhB subunit
MISMKGDTMSAESASSAALGLGLKTGALAGMAAMVVSLLAVALGFTVVPLKTGDEHRDAARRLAAGLLSSFTLGPALAFKAIDWWPWLMEPWARILAGQHVLWQYLATAAPFMAITAVLGFWIIAAVMRWFTNRADKDIAQLAEEAKQAIKP